MWEREARGDSEKGEKPARGREEGDGDGRVWGHILHKRQRWLVWLKAWGNLDERLTVALYSSSSS
jgi:hypothetical protein